MLSSNEERGNSKRDRKAKVKNFPGATIDDMYEHIKPLLNNCPDRIILHVGTNSMVNEASKVVLRKFFGLTKSTENTLP